MSELEHHSIGPHEKCNSDPLLNKKIYKKVVVSSEKSLEPLLYTQIIIVALLIPSSSVNNCGRG